MSFGDGFDDFAGHRGKGIYWPYASLAFMAKRVRFYRYATYVIHQK